MKNTAQLIIAAVFLMAVNTSFGQQICEGDSVQLILDQYNGTLQWEDSTADQTWTPISGGNVNNLVVTPIQDSWYRGEVTANDCAPFYTDTIAINVLTTSIAPIGIWASDSTICGDSIWLKPSGGTLGESANWLWSSDSCAGMVISTADSVKVGPSMSTTYFLKAVSNCDTSACVSLPIIVEVAPSEIIAQLSQDGLCVGEELTLTASGTSVDTWKWTGPNGFSSSLQNPTIPAITAADSGYYRLDASSICGELTTFTEFLTVDSMVPTDETIGSIPSSICEGEILTLSATATGASIWNWTGPNGFVSDQQHPTMDITSDLQSGIYELIPASYCGVGSAVVTENITVNNLPTSIDITVDQDTVCQGATVTISATGTLVDTWAWYGPNGYTSTSQVVEIDGIVEDQEGIYYVVTSNACGATDSVGSDVIIVDQLPGNGFAQSNQHPACFGGSLSIFVSSVGATSYEWTGPNGFTSNDRIIEIASFTPEMEGIYTVIPSSACGAAQTLFTSEIVGNAGPINVIGQVYTDDHCIGDQMVLAAFADEAQYWHWFHPNGLDTTLYASQAALRIYDVDTTDNGIYGLVSSNICGNSDTVYTQPAVVNYVPEPPVATSQIAGTDFVLWQWETNENATSYQWEHSDTYQIADDIGNVSNYMDNQVYCGRNETFYLWASNQCGISEPTLINQRTQDCPFVCGSSKIYDVDSNAYNTIQLGDQCWLRENMRTTSYPDGTPITKGQVVNNIGGWTWDQAYYSCPASLAGTAEDCDFASSTGLLYQYSAAMGSISNQEEDQGICPTNWYIPTDGDWKLLEGHVGMSPTDQNATGKRGAREGSNLAGPSITGGHEWASNATIRFYANDYNTSGFRGAPTGYRRATGQYMNRTVITGYWNSTSHLYKRVLAHGDGRIERMATGDKAEAWSVRCIRGEVVVVTPPTDVQVVPNNTDICDGSTLELLGFATDATSWSWTGPNGFASSDQNVTLTNLSALEAGTYTLIATNDIGNSSPAEVDITVVALPTGVNAVLSETTLCQGELLTLSATVSEGDDLTYAWTGPNNFEANALDAVIDQVGTSSAGNYSFTTSNQCGTFGPTVAGTLVVNPIPSSVTASVDIGTLCVGETLTLSVTANDANSYQWTGPNGYTSTVQNPTLTADISGQFYAKASNDCGSVISFSNAVSVIQLPSNLGAVGSPIQLCIGEQFTLTGYATNATNWSWTGPNDFTSTDQEVVFNALQSDQFGTYQLTVDGECGALLDTAHVDVYQYSTSPVPALEAVHDLSSESINWKWTAQAYAAGYKVNTVADYSTAQDLGGAHFFSESNLQCDSTHSLFVWAYAICGDTAEVAEFSATTLQCFDCGDELIDYRNMRTYATVQIGDQCWMSENLRYGEYIHKGNQTDIPGIQMHCVELAGSNSSASVCAMGGLYWFEEALAGQQPSDAVPSGVQGVCPTGWHLPSDGEWCLMEDFLAPGSFELCSSDSFSIAQVGDQIKTVDPEMWVSPNVANNSSGFSAIPAGYSFGGSYNLQGESAEFWTSSKKDDATGWARNIWNHDHNLIRSGRNKYIGISVRCVED